MRNEQVDDAQERKLNPRAAEFVPSESLREFYRAFVRRSGAWRRCTQRACLRGRGCAGKPACFERHPEIFLDFMRTRVRPLLQAEISLQSGGKTTVEELRRGRKRGAASKVDEHPFS
jgi:hypothetical protein